MISTLKELLGLTATPIPHPFVKVDSPAAPQPPKPRTEKPGNIVYHADRAFLQEEIEPGVIEDTRWTGGGTKSLEVVQVDLDIIFQERLDEERYRTLKPYWVANMSAQETAKMFRGQRGYSPRTLDNYWKAFNTVHQLKTPSPGQKVGG